MSKKNQQRSSFIQKVEVVGMIASVIAAGSGVFFGFSQVKINRDQQKISKDLLQMQELRPIVLYEGSFESFPWLLDSFEYSKDGRVSGQVLIFKSYEHVAINISAYLVKDRMKHVLNFSNQDISLHDGDTLRGVEVWGWLPPDSYVDAIPVSKEGVPTNEDDGIYIHYSDVQDNPYMVRVDEDGKVNFLSS